MDTNEHESFTLEKPRAPLPGASSERSQVAGLCGQRSQAAVDSFKFVCIRGLTQLAFLKQGYRNRERSADVANDVCQRFADVTPLKGVPAGVKRVSEPEKLPIRRHRVKHGRPP